MRKSHAGRASVPFHPFEGAIPVPDAFRVSPTDPRACDDDSRMDRRIVVSRFAKSR
jgi:hypothetical protein